jgi:hypothetical protein
MSTGWLRVVVTFAGTHIAGEMSVSDACSSLFVIVDWNWNWNCKALISPFVLLCFK